MITANTSPLWTGFRGYWTPSSDTSSRSFPQTTSSGTAAFARLGFLGNGPRLILQRQREFRQLCGQHIFTIKRKCSGTKIQALSTPLGRSPRSDVLLVSFCRGEECERVEFRHCDKRIEVEATSLVAFSYAGRWIDDFGRLGDNGKLTNLADLRMCLRAIKDAMSLQSRISLLARLKKLKLTWRKGARYFKICNENLKHLVLIVTKALALYRVLELVG